LPGRPFFVLPSRANVVSPGAGYALATVTADPPFSPAPAAVAERVVSHYRRHARDLPWRRTRDPYAIWVSEIMLQQTRVATVIPYWERWLERFPTPTALADAPLDDVLAAWSGLGYYSRARNLHKGARDVVERFAGELPATAAELRTLPGIGRYTAGAISSIAFGQQEPLVDGNVARLFARVYEIEDDVRSTASQKMLWKIAEAAVPETAPGDFNQGLMELGATVCTPTGPACLGCPLEDLCRARAAGRQTELPVMPRRKKSNEKPLIDACAYWIERKQAVLMARRPPGGLYGGMWELPSGDDRDDVAKALGLDLDVVGGEDGAAFEHSQELSHRRLRLRLWPARLVNEGAAEQPADASRYDRLTWQPVARLGDLGLSSATKKLVAGYRKQRRAPDEG